VKVVGSMGVVIARDVSLLPTPGSATLTRGYKMYHPAGVEVQDVGVLDKHQRCDSH